ncbi:MAG: recombinase family protein [Chloroflexota bacterium]|nr:recombinase family protein [Chloroflexota bacterium]
MIGQGKRAAMYVRVSSDEQVQGYSLDAQVRAIETYCALHGYEIVARYRDEGKSARTDNLAKRPDFARMVADAGTKAFDLIVVHKLDRFARNLRVTLETLDRLEKVGVGFVSISEQMDFATPMGRVVLSTMGSLAQFYSDNLSSETKKGKRERKSQGLYNGLLPFGTTKNANGVPAADPHTHPGLVLAFELAAAGKTDREIAQALTAAGYRTTGNRGANPFTKDTVRVILRNRFYLGELPDGAGGWIVGKHDALIDPVLFERAAAARAANLKPRWTASPARSPWGLSGIASCGRCGRPVVVDGRRRVCCSGRSQGNGCTEPSYPANVVEEQIGAYLQGFAVPEGERERLLTAWRRAQHRPGDTVAARQALHRKLDRVKELYLAGDLERSEYQERKAALTRDLAALPDVGDPDNRVGEQLAAFLADVPAAWTAATPAERNRLARELFRTVVVANRTAVAVVPRPDLRPFFECLSTYEGDLRNRRKRRGSLKQKPHCHPVPSASPLLHHAAALRGLAVRRINSRAIAD